jgi:hypothetical protein
MLRTDERFQPLSTDRAATQLPHLDMRALPLKQQRSAFAQSAGLIETAQCVGRRPSLHGPTSVREIDALCVWGECDDRRNRRERR